MTMMTSRRGRTWSFCGAMLFGAILVACSNLDLEGLSNNPKAANNGAANGGPGSGPVTTLDGGTTNNGGTTRDGGTGRDGGATSDGAAEGGTNPTSCGASPAPPAPVLGTPYYFSDCQAGASAACVLGSNANAGTSPDAPKQNLTGFDVNALPAGTQLLFA